MHTAYGGCLLEKCSGKFLENVRISGNAFAIVVNALRILWINHVELLLDCIGIYFQLSRFAAAISCLVFIFDTTP
jgi:hypothetical protein